MSTQVGPTRLIVIRSGKYDYGEIDLTAPVHLVGPNNVGKTSLIALLQLLYVDSQQYMKFSRPLDESKRYYFPDTTSYVLFEVLTPTGYQVVGVHGLGAVKRHDFERFTYEGMFDAADYIAADRIVRENRDVRLRLADRHYTTLEPKHLRAALTGVGQSRDVNLGLVPLRHRDHYSRFRTVFQHLLRLSQIRQKELKNLLLDLYRGDFRQFEIVLARDMSENLRIIRQGQTDIREWHALRPDVTKLLEYVKIRGRARRAMLPTWRRLGRASNDRRHRLTTTAQALVEQKQALVQREADLRSRHAELEAQRDTATKRLALLENKREHLQAAGKQFGGFVLEFKQQEQLDLQNKLADLDVRLHAGRTEDAPTITRRLQQLRATREDLATRLATLAESAGARLFTLLPDETTRQAVFKLFDAGILRLPWGPAGFKVTSEDEFTAWLNDFQARRDGSVYHGHGVQVELSALPEPDLASYLNAERITADLAEVDHDLKRHEEILAAIAAMQELAVARKQLQDRRDALVKEIEGWHQHVEALAGEPALLKELQQLTKEKSELTGGLARISEGLHALKDQEYELSAKVQATDGEQIQLDETLASLSAPNPEWLDPGQDAAPSVEEDEASDQDFDDISRHYLRLQNDQARYDERVQERLRIVEDRTYGKHTAATEAETVAALQQQIEALPEREKSIQELWRSLAVDLRSSFKALLEDLNFLIGRVDVLNRQLGKVTVSNLTRVRLIVEERPEWKRQIHDLLAFEDMPLFAEPQKTEAAIDEVGKLLDQHERIQLADLFGFRFEITTTDGQTRRYDNLDSIESNGTTITIKILINVLLLRELLNRDDVQMPYYLDEASSLDQDNLAAIVSYSRERGFIPVLASPDPMEAAEHLYFIAETEGRVVLDPVHSRIDLKARNSDKVGAVE